MKAAVVIVVGIILLVLVNLMLAYKPYSAMEAFQAATTTMPELPTLGFSGNGAAGSQGASPSAQQGGQYKANLEGFTSYFLSDAAGSKDKYTPMGAYDGVTLPTGNDVSSWRYTAPNEKLLGDEFVPGPDSLFMFKNNQCKPECCGASFSCGGGCVCTTPEQRQYIAGRGGNRTAPEDSA